MTDSILAGLVAGYAVSVPVGALAVLLVNLAARTSLRTGLAGALGVATADGAYAAVAVAGGAAVAGPARQVATPLRWGAALVLLGVAAHILLAELRTRRTGPTGDRPRARRPGRPAVLDTPLRAYLGLLGLTLLNPWAIIYFSALMLGHQAIDHPGWSPPAFVAAVAVASLSWQALLACGGAGLGRVLTGPRPRLIAALLSATTIAALAAAMALTA